MTKPVVSQMLLLSLLEDTFYVFSEIEDPQNISKLIENRLAMSSTISFSSTAAKPPFHLWSSVCPICLSGP